MYKKRNKKYIDKVSVGFLLIIIGIIVLMYTSSCMGQTEEIPDTIITEANDSVDEIEDEENKIEEVESDTYSNITMNTITIEPMIENIVETEKPVIYDFDVIGYTIANLNVRTEPNTECEILDVLDRYDEIQFSYLDDNDEWVVINYDGRYAYLCKKYIEEGLPYEVKSAENDTRKSYMDWKAITCKTSKQWELQHKYAYTESNGVRAVNGRYCIALGSYYTHEIGQYVDVVLDNGLIIPCILGDAKQDRHTTNNHSIGLDGGVVEFIVNTESLNSKVRKSGDVSYTSEDWRSHVVELRIYYKNLFD